MEVLCLDTLFLFVVVFCTKYKQKIMFYNITWNQANAIGIY